MKGRVGRQASQPLGSSTRFGKVQDLDYSLYWVIHGKLAGRAGPHKFPWDLRELKATGIGGIVSLDGYVDSAELAAAGIEHLPIYQPMVLLDSEEAAEQFLEVMPPVLGFIDRCLRRQSACLIHCYHGCDRSGTVLAASLVARASLSAEEAILHVRKGNPMAMFAPGYAEAVHTFERLYRANPAAYSVRRADEPADDSK